VIALKKEKRMNEREAFKSLDEFKEAYLPEQYKREQLDLLWQAALASQEPVATVTCKNGEWYGRIPISISKAKKVEVGMKLYPRPQAQYLHNLCQEQGIEIDVLKAKLEALASQEPVGYVATMPTKDLQQVPMKLMADMAHYIACYTSPQPDLQDARIKEICYYALNRFIQDHDTGKKIFTNNDVENYTIEAMKAKG
jgi:hypothetical protein